GSWAADRRRHQAAGWFAPPAGMLLPSLSLKRRQLNWQSSGLLIRRVGGRVPGGAPPLTWANAHHFADPSGRLGAVLVAIGVPGARCSQQRLADPVGGVGHDLRAGRARTWPSC